MSSSDTRGQGQSFAPASADSFTIQPRWRLSFHAAPGPEPAARRQATRLRLLALGGYALGNVLHGATCHSAFAVRVLEQPAAPLRA